MGSDRTHLYQVAGAGRGSVATRPVRGETTPPTDRVVTTGPAPVSGPLPQVGRDLQPLARYRFVVADDEQVWSGGSGQGGLLQLSDGEQVEAFDHLTRDDSALVVTCSPRQALVVRRASALARSRSQARVAVVPLPLGPLGQSALTLIAQQVVATATSRPVAELIAWLPSVAEAVLDLALVRNVARLDHPSVGVRHHLASYLPLHQAFAVQLAPEPAIARVARDGSLRPAAHKLAAPAFDESYGTVMVVAGRRPVPDSLLPLCRTTSAPPAAPTALHLGRFWGDPEATEIVVAPADVTRWALDRLPSLETWPCTWCAEPLAAPMNECVFCGNSVR
jgi:hypothetical protein